jgi:hypothetical protein
MNFWRFELGRIVSPQFSTSASRHRWQVLAGSHYSLRELLLRHIEHETSDVDTEFLRRRNRRTQLTSFESRFRINDHSYLRIVTRFGNRRTRTLIEEIYLARRPAVAGPPK